MKKLIMILAFACIPCIAMAGYDIDTIPFANVDTMTVDELADTDYVQVYRTSTGDSEVIALPNIATMVEDLTAVGTLTTADCGKTLMLNSATEFATTLPSPTSGCVIRFVVKAAPASASYTVVTASSANILIGGINELEVDTGDDGPYDNDGDTITFVDAVAVVGDFVELVSDGTRWYLHGQTNADGGSTITKAS